MLALALALALQSAGTLEEPASLGGSGSYGVQLARSLAALAGVCVLAWWSLRWAARRGIGGPRAGRHATLLEKLPLEGRRALYLVEVGSHVLVVGGAEQSLTLLAQIPRAELGTPTPASTPPAAVSFREVLARLRGAPPSPPDPT